MTEPITIKILHLPLKAKWYDMQERGEKPEEYREITPYWCKRFLGFDTALFSYRHNYKSCNTKNYTHVLLRYGYTKRYFIDRIDSITIGRGNPEWGAPTDRDVFIIRHHKEDSPIIKGERTMSPDIIIKGKALYTTKGAAREYGRIGCNFYTGCPHECTYCYLKRGAPSKQLGGNKVQLKACFKNEQHAADTLRRELDKHLGQCRRYGIFLSFSTDPLIDETRGLTSVAITECVMREIPVWVLTKCSTFIYDECDFMAWLEAINLIYRGSIHFGFTLTGHDEMEPRANTNQDRIMAMQRMDLMGFSTFASIEPVITWKAAERMVHESVLWCDHYKLGLRSGVKKNYYDITESGAAIERIVRTVENFGKTIYLKESTCQLLKQYFQPGAYEAFLSHTVDMDGKRIEL